MIAADTNTDAANVAAIVAAFDGDTFARLTAPTFVSARRTRLVDGFPHCMTAPHGRQTHQRR
jgi:hypothetical protein